MMKPVLRISGVTSAGPTSLDVTWSDGARARVDLAGWIAKGGAALAGLRDRRVFALAQVAESSDAIRWTRDDCQIAIEADHLWWIASEQRPFDHGDVAAWQAEIRLSNQEASEFLGISLSAWNTYKAGTVRMPVPVAMVCRAALRDPILLQARYRPRKRGRPRRLEASPQP